MSEGDQISESLAAAQGRVLGVYIAAAIFVIRRASEGDAEAAELAARIEAAELAARAERIAAEAFVAEARR